jgi:hypothetical protein
MELFGVGAITERGDADHNLVPATSFVKQQAKYHAFRPQLPNRESLSEDSSQIHRPVITAKPCLNAYVEKAKGEGRLHRVGRRELLGGAAVYRCD